MTTFIMESHLYGVTVNKVCASPPAPLYIIHLSLTRHWPTGLPLATVARKSDDRNTTPTALTWEGALCDDNTAVDLSRHEKLAFTAPKHTTMSVDVLLHKNSTQVCFRFFPMSHRPRRRNHMQQNQTPALAAGL